MNSSPSAILNLGDGIKFEAGPRTWIVPPTTILPGQWVAFTPGGDDPIVDPAGTLSRTLATLSEPQRGAVELFQKDIYALSYREVQRMRARLGFVQGYGGLLSNHSISENIRLPASVHGGFSVAEETARVNSLLEEFELDQIGDFAPHQVDGYTRWRSCLARALVLRPKWVVLEGIGDWEMDRGRGIAWRKLHMYHKIGDNGIAICMSRKNPEFEAWIQAEGGMVVAFSSVKKSNNRSSAEHKKNGEPVTK